MNKLCISGRLTTNPHYSEHENDVKRCSIFLANDLYYSDKKRTGFYRATAWGKKAELINEQCKVGTEIFITGHLEQYCYQDENGKTIYDNSISIEEFNFGTNKVETE